MCSFTMMPLLISMSVTWAGCVLGVMPVQITAMSASISSPLFSRTPSTLPLPRISALHGEDGPMRDLILYNAALRLWTLEDEISLDVHLERAREVLESAAVLSLAPGLREVVSG